MDPIARDLQRWIPRLLAVFRRLRKLRPGPEDRLLPHELREVSSAVRALSLGLTRDREMAGRRYMEDPKLLGAYLLFFWPISYAQARHCLSELTARPRSVLDLGSGPGPLAFACLDVGAGEAIAADRSQAALALVRELAAEAGEAISTRAWNGFSSAVPVDGKVDLITLGHVLNELWPGQPDAASRRAGLAERLAGFLRPGGSLLLIEPALRETSRALLEVRDRLVDRGFPVRSPCLFRGPCPVLARPGDWCHAERPWNPPALVEAIGRAAGLRKDALKMSYLVLAPRGEPLPRAWPGQVFRIISEPLASKGRQRYIGCGPRGHFGLALQDKHRTEQNAAFSRLARGDVIEIKGPVEEKGDGLALGPESRVEVLARAGLPLPPPPGDR